MKKIYRNVNLYRIRFSFSKFGPCGITIPFGIPSSVSRNFCNIKDAIYDNRIIPWLRILAHFKELIDFFVCLK